VPALQLEGNLVHPRPTSTPQTTPPPRRQRALLSVGQPTDEEGGLAGAGTWHGTGQV
jgi:hypothetical protein